MITALLSLFGGTAFRLFIGNAFNWVQQLMDKKEEMDKMKLQAQLDQQAHLNKLEEIKAAAAANIQTIQAQADINSQAAGDAAFIDAVQGINKTVEAIKPTGKWWIDIIPTLIMCWNQAIRPCLASVAVVLWVMALMKQGWVTTDYDKELISAVLGIFIGDRIHAKRNQ